MPANSEELTTLFANHGLESFLHSTRTLVVLISLGGKLLAWNSAFDSIKQSLPDTVHLRDFLSLSSRTVFDLLLSTVTHDRVKSQGELDLGQGDQLSGYTCFLYPASDDRILFVAEPSHAILDLESLSDELQKTKQILERKETELQAVLSQAREISNTDALTSLPSRRQIMAELQEYAAFADRYGTLLAVLMLDIDYFKKLNDTHGHMIGDEVLRNLAVKLGQFVHPPETLGRYGGEEFLLVLPHHATHSVTDLAGRLVGELRAWPISIDNLSLSITVSIGIAQYKVRKEDWQTFLSRAEQALLLAKERGRDQWVLDGM